jgi:hypothetical protein
MAEMLIEGDAAEKRTGVLIPGMPSMAAGSACASPGQPCLAQRGDRQ